MWIPRQSQDRFSKRLSLSVSFCCSGYLFRPIVPAQFEELLLEDPEVEATAAPAGLLVDTDLRI